MALSGVQRILDDCRRACSAADASAWCSAASSCQNSCSPVLKKTLPPAAARWLLQNGLSEALTSALASGLRILQQQLLDSATPAAVAVNDQAMQLLSEILQLFDVTRSWGDAWPYTEAGYNTYRAEALSAEFISAAAAACSTLAQLLPELTQQELAAQQRYEQQAGRAARRHGRSNTDHYPPSARLLSFMRLSSGLVCLWADLSTRSLKHHPQAAPAPAAAAAATTHGPLAGSAAQQQAAADRTYSSCHGTTSSSGGSCKAMTSSGDGAAAFPGYIMHTAPLAAAVVHCWQRLEHSAADNKAWEDSQQMLQLPSSVADVEHKVITCMAPDMFSAFINSRPGCTARTSISQLPLQLPWLLMYCFASYTAAMYNRDQGTLSAGLSGAAAAAAAAAASLAACSSSHGSSRSRCSEPAVPPYHIRLLEALWQPGPHPPGRSYPGISSNMPATCLMPTAYVLAEILGGNAPVMPAMPLHGSTTSSSSSSTVSAAGVSDASLAAAPATPQYWWGLSPQTLLLLLPVVAENMALGNSTMTLSVEMLVLKSLHCGVQALLQQQQQQQQQQQAFAGSPGKRGLWPTALSSPVHSAGAPGGTASGAASMLEAVAQLAVPVAQRALAAAAANSGDRDQAMRDLQVAYGLIAANIGPGTFLSQGSWQVPSPAVLSALEAAVRAEQSCSGPSSPTQDSLGRKVLHTVLADAAAAKASVPGLSTGGSCHDALPQQHNSSSSGVGSNCSGGTAKPDAGSLHSPLPHAGSAAALGSYPDDPSVAAWAGLLVSCLKATAASCCSSSDSAAAGCMAQPCSSSTTAVQPAAGGSSPGAGQAGANAALASSLNAVCALLGAASLACPRPHAAATGSAASRPGAKGCGSSGDSRRESVRGAPGPAGSGSSNHNGRNRQDQGHSHRPSQHAQGTAPSGPQLQLQVPPGWGFVVGKALYHAGSLLATQNPRPPAAAPAGAPAVQAVLAAGVQEVLKPFAAACAGVRSMLQQAAPADVIGWKQGQLVGLVDTLSDAVTQAEAALLGGMGCAVRQGFSDQAAAAAAPASQGGDTCEREFDQVSAWVLLLGTPAAQQLSQALLDLGAALCACLPSRTACNHPACTVVNKVSEAQLVSGKGKTCSGCMLARYCCAAHQQLHWKAHKAACRALAAALPAAGSSSGGQKKSVKSKKQAK